MKLFLVNACLFFLSCANWAFLDFMYVRSGSDFDSFWNNDWLLLPVFLLIVGVNAALQKGTPWLRAGLSLGMAFTQLVLLVIAVLAFGIPFHFSIGGQL